MNLSSPIEPTAGLTVAESLLHDLNAAEALHLRDKPGEALARTQQALRRYASDASHAKDPEATRVANLLRHRAPLYRRAVTRRAERSTLRGLRYRERQRQEFAERGTQEAR